MKIFSTWKNTVCNFFLHFADLQYLILWICDASNYPDVWEKITVLNFGGGLFKIRIRKTSRFWLMVFYSHSMNRCNLSRNTKLYIEYRKLFKTYNIWYPMKSDIADIIWNPFRFNWRIFIRYEENLVLWLALGWFPGKWTNSQWPLMVRKTGNT